MSHRATRCIGCDSGRLDFRPAIVAPFIAARVFMQPPSLCRVARCQACRLMFFEDRFDGTEAERLYSGYRDPQYFTERHRTEPWYTQQFNDTLGGTEEITGRRRAYQGTISRIAPGAVIHTVLDYGGDRGQLMVGGPGDTHYLFDISNMPPEPSVIKLDHVTLAGRTFDLVLLCEVLEHVAAPLPLLRQVATHVRSGGFLYVTLPNAEFQFDDIPAAPWYETYLRFMITRRRALMLADFWSTGFRIKFGHLPPLGFAKLHEHINFFNRDSLTVLLRDAGFEILECGIVGDGRGLEALCRRLW